MNTQVVPIIPTDQLERWAHSLVKSRMFGLDNVDQAMSLMLIAQAEGKHPAIIARDFHIIDGRPSKKSEAMLRDFLGGGGLVQWIKLDDTTAKAKFSHPLGGEVEIEWDLARAQKAGLVGKKGDMYGKYTRQMLRSRCVSEGVRTVGPFATSGVYTPEEVRDITMTPPPERPKDVTPPPPEHKLDQELVKDHLVVIDGAVDLEDLRRAFQLAYSAAKQAGDFNAVEKFTKAKDDRKRELTAEDVQP